MILTRREPRAAFRVYTEEEYLAGVDLLAQEDGRPAREHRRPRKLGRLAGAAALTGAVGAVSALAGLAALRSHRVYRRELPAQLTVPALPARSPRRVARPIRRRRLTRARLRPTSARGSQMKLAVSTGAPKLRAAPASRVQVITASAPLSAHANQPATGEFGFER